MAGTWPLSVSQSTWVCNYRFGNLGYVGSRLIRSANPAVHLWIAATETMAALLRQLNPKCYVSFEEELIVCKREWLNTKSNLAGGTKCAARIPDFPQQALFWDVFFSFFKPGTEPPLGEGTSCACPALRAVPGSPAVTEWKAILWKSRFIDRGCITGNPSMMHFTGSDVTWGRPCMWAF